MRINIKKKKKDHNLINDLTLKIIFILISKKNEINIRVIISIMINNWGQNK